MTVPQQKLQGSDHRCRLAMPSLHVPRAHLSWHWDPDALARWYTLMPTCRLVSRTGSRQQKLLLVTGLALGTRCGKARSRLKEWITSVLDYYRVWHPRRRNCWKL